MPELPEVETLCRQLREVIVDRQILSSRVIDPKLEHLPPLAGKTVRSVSRHGKKMVWTLSDGMCLVFQLRMTGRFFWLEKDEIPPHARLELTFRGGRLILSDPRRFATVQLCSPPAPSPVPDGLEKLEPRRLAEAARRRRLPVKSFLMDQKTVAGIGNIYASEILHEAGIDPMRPACSLDTGRMEEDCGFVDAHSGEGRQIPGNVDLRLAGPLRRPRGVPASTAGLRQERGALCEVPVRDSARS